jgi:hypothetical protein
MGKMGATSIGIGSNQGEKRGKQNWGTMPLEILTKQCLACRTLANTQVAQGYASDVSGGLCLSHF